MRVTIAFILLIFTFSNSIALEASSKSNNYLYTEPDCNFFVEFPDKPKINKHYIVDSDSEFNQANYSTEDSSFMRAECLPIERDLVTPEYLIEVAALQSKNDGLMHVEISHKKEAFFDIIELRGYKEIAGFKVTYQYFIYLGENSLLMLYVGALSQVYPTEKIVKFRNSVRLK